MPIDTYKSPRSIKPEYFRKNSEGTPKLTDSLKRQVLETLGAARVKISGSIAGVGSTLALPFGDFPLRPDGSMDTSLGMGLHLVYQNPGKVEIFNKQSMFLIRSKIPDGTSGQMMENEIHLQGIKEITDVIYPVGIVCRRQHENRKDITTFQVIGFDGEVLVDMTCPFRFFDVSHDYGMFYSAGSSHGSIYRLDYPTRKYTGVRTDYDEPGTPYVRGANSLEYPIVENQPIVMNKMPDISSGQVFFSHAGKLIAGAGENLRVVPISSKGESVPFMNGISLLQSSGGKKHNVFVQFKPDGPGQFKFRRLSGNFASVTQNTEFTDPVFSVEYADDTRLKFLRSVHVRIISGGYGGGDGIEGINRVKLRSLQKKSQ